MGQSPTLAAVYGSAADCFCVSHLPRSRLLVRKRTEGLFFCYILCDVSHLLHSRQPRLSFHAAPIFLDVSGPQRYQCNSQRFSLIITIAVSTVTTMLLAAFGGEASQTAWTTVVILYGVIAEIAILVTFFGVKEKKRICWTRMLMEANRSGLPSRMRSRCCSLLGISILRCICSLLSILPMEPPVSWSIMRATSWVMPT